MKGKYIDSYKAMIKLYNEGLIRAIGVSNFHIHHLEHLMRETDVVPVVNQIELHPWLNQGPVIEFCKSIIFRLKHIVRLWEDDLVRYLRLRILQRNIKNSSSDCTKVGSAKRNSYYSKIC